MGNNCRKFVRRLKPWSVIIYYGLCCYLVFRETIISQPQTIILIAIPLLLQTFGIFALAYGAAKLMKLLTTSLRQPV